MLPGLAFFYAGLLHRHSVVTMIMQNYACSMLLGGLSNSVHLAYRFWC